MRDVYGVPHVFSDTNYGLYYGFGYALGQDQLYQVELLKRTARGRVAEVLGRSYLPIDEASRTRIDIDSLARQYNVLPANDRAVFQGMANGLNAYISTVIAKRATLLPRGFIEAGFLPERWSPIDVLAVYQHSMANRFSDLNAETENLALLSRLRRSQGAKAAWPLFTQLRWTDDKRAPTTIAPGDGEAGNAPTFAAPSGTDAIPNRLRNMPASVPKSITMSGGTPHASNAWVASPSWTGTGEAVLVNGPQMGYFATSYIWAVGLHGPGFDIVGSGPVGSPWLIFGTNGKIGWGATAGLGDTVDIYQEVLDPDNPRRYRFNGAWRLMTRRDETIGVKGEPDVRLQVWSTIHGVVDSYDPDHGAAYTRRRTWEGREVGSLVAWIHAMKARDYQGWRANVSKVAIGVNNYYVDWKGNIAYQFLGLFPIRPKDQDFRLPAVGDGSMEWKGFHDPLDNPHELNPPGGLMANWNNKPQAGYANSDFMYWGQVDRVTEIDAAAATAKGHGSNPLWDMVSETSFQDVTSRHYLTLLQTYKSELTKRAPEAMALLLNWDGTLSDRDKARAKPGYILYRTFMERLLALVFAKIVPDDPQQRTAPDADLRRVDPVFPSMGAKIAYAALAAPQDSPLLAGREPAALLSSAVEQAWAMTVAKFGTDPANWNEPAMPHDFVALNYAGVPNARGVDATSLPVLMNRGTENDRIIFRNGQVSYCDVTPPGQSAFVAPNGVRSSHARDQLGLYANFGCKRQWITPAEVNSHAVTQIRLQAHRLEY